jgi:hypothetical protein|tara:strand:+ start:586 stop:2667 length:2082 start_codon:yes stop_codon:yes gene_type:complete
MSLVNFTNLDFEDVKTTLKEYLKSNSNFTDYDFEGSNLSTILDVLAYNTYITSYNANMVANEVFIDTATLRENVVALARNVGYTPRSRKAAISAISFFVDASNITPKPASITLRKGTVAASTGVFGGSSGAFCILDDITVPVINGVAAFNEIPIYEGTVVEKNFTFSARNPQQKFILPNVGIDTDLIRVGVKNNEFSTATVKYSLQDNLFYVGSDSKVYFLQEVSDERYEVFFGDGVFGKKLDDQNYITVTYLVTNGDAGNGFSQFSFNGRLTYVRDGSEYTVTSGISLITPEYSSRGGSAIEEVESVRKYAPKIYSTQNRAVTADDYETLIPAKIYPDTESISVFGGEELIPPQYGKVFISIKPRFGDFLPNLIKDNIKLKLKKYAVAGVVPEILDLKYLYLEVSSRVYYNTNLAPSAAEVSTIVSNNAAKYADSTELNKYGARFKYSKFLKIIDDSHDSVTSNITVVKMRRDLRVVPNTIAEYQIGFGNQFYISSMTGYNIKTSSFRVSGISENVYIGDIPNSNRQTGTLFFFTVPNIGSQSPVVIRSNVGTIDYVNGIITINAINIIAAMQKDSQEIIEIQATPLSNDVVGLQDLYLQLDTSNSTFEMVSDEIASGLDPSASNYIVSSSYAEGNLVRAGGPDNVITTAATDAVNATTSTNSSFTGTTTVTTSTSGATGGSSTPSGSGSGY